jgi:hypothetical protein
MEGVMPTSKKSTSEEVVENVGVVEPEEVVLATPAKTNDVSVTALQKEVEELKARVEIEKGKAKTAAQESIERRLEIKELKEKLAALETPADNQTEGEPLVAESIEVPEKEKTSFSLQPDISPDEIAELVLKRMEEKRQAEAKAQEEKSKALNALLEEHNLSGNDAARQIVSTSNDPAGVAKLLGDTLTSFAVGSVNPSVAPTETLFERAQRRVLEGR